MFDEVDAVIHELSVGVNGRSHAFDVESFDKNVDMCVNKISRILKGNLNQRSIYECNWRIADVYHLKLTHLQLLDEIDSNNEISDKHCFTYMYYFKLFAKHSALILKLCVDGNVLPNQQEKNTLMSTHKERVLNCFKFLFSKERYEYISSISIYYYQTLPVYYYFEAMNIILLSETAEKLKHSMKQSNKHQIEQLLQEAIAIYEDVFADNKYKQQLDLFTKEWLINEYEKVKAMLNSIQQQLIDNDDDNQSNLPPENENPFLTISQNNEDEIDNIFNHSLILLGITNRENTQRSPFREFEYLDEFINTHNELEFIQFILQKYPYSKNISVDNIEKYYISKKDEVFTEIINGYTRYLSSLVVNTGEDQKQYELIQHILQKLKQLQQKYIETQEDINLIK
jgi:hypothetical protein